MKTNKLFTLIFALTLFIASCSKINDFFEQDKKDLPDRTAAEAGPRVIAGTMSIVEILDDLGYKNVVGVPSSRHPMPELYAKTEKIGKPMQPDLEVVKRLNAEIYLASLGSKPTLDKLFQNQNIKTEYIDLNSYEACLNTIRQLGELTSKQKEAEHVIQTIEAKTLEVRRSVNGKKSPKVLMLLGSPKKLMMGTRNCYTGSLMEVLKIHNIANGIGNFDKTYVPVNIEEIVKHQPDVIIRLTHTKAEDTAESLRAEFAKNEIWQKVKAVKEDKIYDLDSNLYTVSRNIKIMYAVENLKEIIYGETEN
ncbi:MULTISPECIES: ABC transporter substrate-binding protein [unclassified Treponema]|uniref:ABC transporter substrate-binding protein n=1 Tax=unclassified Treponema TaxID=2638727 RepID=UPI0020A2FB01|nr:MULTISPECIES: ABC transporter substrate-binding protein [unclassified Treponema]UTC67466.1 ABC transporter substrate-binding protein [Treponema sp. OMZ 789]UTC70194.1 ABC transporter substrate-binding protein [Treponema sp. OMZ 790]UTC72909.1 ABC transporter substrate-binding protein [Treponema sp. OMZ 791]